MAKKVKVDEWFDKCWRLQRAARTSESVQGMMARACKWWQGYGKSEFPVVCNCARARLCVPSSSDEKLRSQNGVQEMAHAGSPLSYIQVLQVLPSTFTFPPVSPPEVSGVESTTQSVVSGLLGAMRCHLALWVFTLLRTHLPHWRSSTRRGIKGRTRRRRTEKIVCCYPSWSGCCRPRM